MVYASIFETLDSTLETSLNLVVELLKSCLEAIAVSCVFLGLLSALWSIVRPPRQHSGQFLNLRLRLGAWWALALEFQLGADILSTTIAPSFAELGRLGAIAVIRTFLNYFLNRELIEEEHRLRDRRLEG